MCYQNAQVYFVTSHLNSEALEIIFPFIDKKRDKTSLVQEICFKK